MFTDHVNISQPIVQGELLPGDVHYGKVYISSLPGYHEDPLYVYRLLEPLYGMPSSARAWHTTMSTFLAKEGCATVGFETSTWTVTIDGARILLGAHINDFVITCTNRQVLDSFRARLLDAFEGTYEGALQHYPSEVTRDMDKGTTYLSQIHYAEEILRNYDLWNVTPRLTPMQPNMRFNKDDCDKNPAPDFHQRYRGIVGSLGCLVTMTRPDIAWVYSELSKYVQFPEKNHILAAEHILCYLRGTWNQTIRYSRDSHKNPNILWGWVDADWAGDTDTRRFYTGCILMMNGGPISWKSRRQDNVSLSTSEAEFVAASQAGQKTIYLRETLTDFGLFQTKATLLHEDNLACVAMSENPVR